VQIELHARICFRKDGSQPKVRISLNVMSSSLSFSVNYRLYKKKVIELQCAIASELYSAYDRDFFIFGKIRILSVG
jgi:hypothetical protein